jgi:glutamate dehydrogenase (NAD(P)+)
MSIRRRSTVNTTGVEDAPALSVTLTGADEKITGWVVADSLVESMAMGGTRMTPSVTEDEVRALARGMTAKMALVGLPIGGAKAGIVAGPERRTETLAAFGRTVAPLLKGGIHLGCDLGTSQADRALFYEAAQYDVRSLPRSAGLPVDWDTYWQPLVSITGFGVGVSALTALKSSPGTADRRIVVQGFGAVGRAVAQYLEDCGHTVVAVADVHGTVSSPRGLPVDALRRLTDTSGTVDRTGLPDDVRTATGPDAWLDVDADILILAANKDALHAGNAHRVKAGLVLEGGNLCCSPEAKKIMAENGVTVVPDVVANAGGASAGGVALTGTVPFDLPTADRVKWVFSWVEKRIHDNTLDVLEIMAAGDRDPVRTLLTARRKAAV